MTSFRIALPALLSLLVLPPIHAVSISQFNVTYTEDFDTLAQATSGVVPAGWAFLETGTGANTTYGATIGSTTTGNTYSFGATSSSDRAFGGIRTTSVATTVGTLVTNDTGGVITNLAIQFVGEQWRLGALARVDRLDFGYSLDATSLADGSWNDVDALDFVGPTTSGISGALDGNAAENRLLVSHSLTGLTLAPGASLWLRWVDFDASGSDDGLGIDNFSIASVQTAIPTQTVPEDLPLPAAAGVIVGLLWSARKFRIRRDRCDAVAAG